MIIFLSLKKILKIKISKRKYLECQLRNYKAYLVATMIA